MNKRQHKIHVLRTNNTCIYLYFHHFKKDETPLVFSILGSVGTAGLNNVVNMLPARDEQEYKLLPQEDVSFVRDWRVQALSRLGQCYSCTRNATGLLRGARHICGKSTLRAAFWPF